VARLITALGLQCPLGILPHHDSVVFLWNSLAVDGSQDCTFCCINFITIFLSIFCLTVLTCCSNTMSEELYNLVCTIIFNATLCIIIKLPVVGNVISLYCRIMCDCLVFVTTLLPCTSLHCNMRCVLHCDAGHYLIFLVLSSFHAWI